MQRAQNEFYNDFQKGRLFKWFNLQVLRELEEFGKVGKIFSDSTFPDQ